MSVFKTNSAAETKAVGEKIGRLLKGGDVVAFKGGLGVGKTTITHGIAKGVGVRDLVSSPTFAIVNVYRGNPSICHFDMYRITGGLDLESTGFYDYLNDSNIILIEWSENIADELGDVITVEIKRLGENKREISVKGGERFENIGD